MANPRDRALELIEEGIVSAEDMDHVRQVHERGRRGGYARL